MTDLFQAAGLENDAPRPLADRLRPEKLSDVVGQDHIVGPDGPITRMLEQGRLGSIILWGPPGTGKTTIARLLSDVSGLHFEQMSAIFSGVADLRNAFDAARMRRSEGRGTLLFVDEVHRFNRAQQDGFLPYMEDGTITLVGATTENPSFELNGAVLSRAQVLVLNRLDSEALDDLLKRAEAHEGFTLPLSENARVSLIAMADGDGRYLLNLAEEILAAASGREGAVLGREELAKLVQQRVPLYDKSRDGHYNLISALHKSIRGSDADAALYWLARMLDGGEDPLFIARRVVRAASEDIGLADPQALTQAIAARDAFEFIGSPEGELALAQAVVYLATAPKSNAVYAAYKSAMRRAKETGSVAPPKIILNAPTSLMEDEGYGDGYRYDHDEEHAFSGQNYFPDGMARPEFYTPSPRGFEKELEKRLAYWAKLRAAKSG